MAIGVDMWKAIPGFSDYKINTAGRVKSFRKGKPRYLNPAIRHGYFYVTLYADGIAKKEYIHRIMLATFVGKCPDGQITLHRDGDRQNNKLSNLHYGTYAENTEDTRRHGRLCEGERGTEAILKESEVLKIRKLRGVITQEALAKQFGVARSTIGSIHQRVSWKHLREGAAA